MASRGSPVWMKPVVSMANIRATCIILSLEVHVIPDIAGQRIIKQ
jgi:hypothetical protein